MSDTGAQASNKKNNQVAADLASRFRNILAPSIMVHYKDRHRQAELPGANAISAVHALIRIPSNIVIPTRQHFSMEKGAG